MKHLFIILSLVFSGCLNGLAIDDDAFQKAKAEYDNGNYANAAKLYGTMLSNGVDNVEVHYNLGNALFKNSNLPQAVWHYRKAWYQAPRDPDIRANLHFALNAAGAIEPAPSFIKRFFTSLSLREWIWVAIANYLLASVLLIIFLLSQRGRSILLRLCVVPGVLMLLAAGGWGQWRDLQTNPEAVVIKSGTTALYGPVEGGTPYYRIPQGALVRLRSSAPNGWAEVEYDGKTGWVNTENILHL